MIKASLKVRKSLIELAFIAFFVLVVYAVITDNPILAVKWLGPLVLWVGYFAFIVEEVK